MSDSGKSGQWTSPSSRVVVTTQMSGPPLRPPGSRSQGSAKGQGVYVWIVMSLLIASTGLAVYDLYLLASFVSTG